MLRTLIDLAGAAEALNGFAGTPRPSYGPSRGCEHGVLLRPGVQRVSKYIVSWGPTAQTIYGTGDWRLDSVMTHTKKIPHRKCDNMAAYCVSGVSLSLLGGSF